MQVRFHRLAAQEYRTVRRWYARRAVGLGQRFVFQVNQAIERIILFPGSCPLFRGSYRWARVRRFPYILYYRLLDQNEIVVMALAHSRRRPGYWTRRKPE